MKLKKKIVLIILFICVLFLNINGVKAFTKQEGQNFTLLPNPDTTGSYVGIYKNVGNTYVAGYAVGKIEDEDIVSDIYEKGSSFNRTALLEYVNNEIDKYSVTNYIFINNLISSAAPLYSSNLSSSLSNLDNCGLYYVFIFSAVDPEFNETNLDAIGGVDDALYYVPDEGEELEDVFVFSGKDGKISDLDTTCASYVSDSDLDDDSDLDEEETSSSSSTSSSSKTKSSSNKDDNPDTSAGNIVSAIIFSFIILGIGIYFGLKRIKNIKNIIK